MLEKNMEKKCCEHEKKLNFMHLKLDRAKNGWSDRSFYGENELHFLVEFKKHGEEPSALQKTTTMRLAFRGHTVCLIEKVEEFKKLGDVFVDAYKRGGD